MRLILAPLVLYQFGTDHVEVLATRLDQASYTSSWRQTTCRISYAHINFAWKGIRHCLINTFLRYGRRLTIVIVAAILRVYSRLVLVRVCISMCSKPPQRTNATVRVNRLPKMLVGRYVAIPVVISHSLFSFNLLTRVFAPPSCPSTSSSISTSYVRALDRNRVLPAAVLAPKLSRVDVNLFCMDDTSTSTMILYYIPYTMCPASRY
jgi:hypothetical protein